MRRLLIAGVILAALTIALSPSFTPAVPETHSRRVLDSFGGAA